MASTLSDILDDGIIDSQEAEQLPKLRDELLEVRRRMDEALALLERAQKGEMRE